MNVDNNMPDEKRKSLLEQLRVSYEMYELSKEDTREQCKKKVDKAGNRIYSDEKIAENIALIETMRRTLKISTLYLVVRRKN